MRAPSVLRTFDFGAGPFFDRTISSSVFLIEVCAGAVRRAFLRAEVYWIDILDGCCRRGYGDGAGLKQTIRHEHINVIRRLTPSRTMRAEGKAQNTFKSKISICSRVDYVELIGNKHPQDFIYLDRRTASPSEGLFWRVVGRCSFFFLFFFVSSVSCLDRIGTFLIFP